MIKTNTYVIKIAKKKKIFRPWSLLSYKFAVRAAKGESRCIDNFVSKAIRLKKKASVDPRCASLPRRTKPFRRTIERGQKSSRCYAKRYEAMETSWSRKRLVFSPPNSPIAPLFFIFLDFRPSKPRVFPTLLDFQHQNLATFLLLSMHNALIRHPAHITNVNFYITLWWSGWIVALCLSRFSSLKFLFLS